MAATQLAEPASRQESPTPDARAVPLDWSEFSTRFFPHRRRHDLEAIVAYGKYRARATERPPEHSRVLLGGQAVMVWEWEGGAAAVEDVRGQEVSDRA